MKLHILSDIYLEFSNFHQPPETDEDVVVLAGDVAKGDLGTAWARDAFPDQEIVYVAGDHEFYDFDRRATLAGNSCGWIYAVRPRKRAPPREGCRCPVGG